MSSMAKICQRNSQKLVLNARRSPRLGEIFPEGSITVVSQWNPKWISQGSKSALDPIEAPFNRTKFHQIPPNHKKHFIGTGFRGINLSHIDWIWIYHRIIPLLSPFKPHIRMTMSHGTIRPRRLPNGHWQKKREARPGRGGWKVHRFGVWLEGCPS